MTIGNNETFIQRLINNLRSEFSLKYFGELHFFLAFKFNEIIKESLSHKSQYAKELFQRAKLVCLASYDAVRAGCYNIHFRWHLSDKQTKRIPEFKKWSKKRHSSALRTKESDESNSRVINTETECGGWNRRKSVEDLCHFCSPFRSAFAGTLHHSFSRAPKATRSRTVYGRFSYSVLIKGRERLGLAERCAWARSCSGPI